MAKTFPIQVVKTRGKQDIFKKEAGGSNELPDWVNDDAVRVNSSIIISQLNDLEGELVNTFFITNVFITLRI